MKNVPKEKPDLKEILIISEFLDVFPYELLGLPLDQKIKFEINQRFNVMNF